MGIAVSLEQRNSNYIFCSLIKSLVVSVFVLLFGFSTTANTRTPSQALPDFFKKYNFKSLFLLDLTNYLVPLQHETTKMPAAAKFDLKGYAVVEHNSSGSKFLFISNIHFFP